MHSLDYDFPSSPSSSFFLLAFLLVFLFVSFLSPVVLFACAGLLFVLPRQYTTYCHFLFSTYCFILAILLISLSRLYYVSYLL